MPIDDYGNTFFWSYSDFIKSNDKDSLKGLKVLADRDYKSITCLRDHSQNKKQPTRDIAQCFVIEDAQTIKL